MREAIDVLRAMPYAEYLTSFHWRLVREVVIDAAQGRCEFSPFRHDARDVHHLTYERLGRELPADVLSVCRECHEYLHSETAGTSSLTAPSRHGLVDDVPLADQATIAHHQALWRRPAEVEGWLRRILDAEATKLARIRAATEPAPGGAS